MSNKSISQSKIIILQKQRTSRSPKFDFGDGDVICFFKILFFTWVIELFDMASTWISKFQQLLWRRPLRPMGRSALSGDSLDEDGAYMSEDEGWKMEDEGWRMMEEGWRMEKKYFFNVENAYICHTWRGFWGWPSRCPWGSPRW